MNQDCLTLQDRQDRQDSSDSLDPLSPLSHSSSLSHSSDELKTLISEIEYKCCQGDINCVKELVTKLYSSQKIIQNVENDYSSIFNTCLLNVCEYGHLNIAKYMIELGADVLNYSLQFACKNNHFAIVKFLVQCGADDLTTAFQEACFYGHFDIVMFLIECGVYEWSVGVYNGCLGGRLNIVKALLARLNDCSSNTNVNGCSAIFFGDGVREVNLNVSLVKACQSGHLEIVKLLMKYGADDLNYGLEAACIHEKFQVVKFLVEHGADELHKMYDWKFNRVQIINLLDLGLDIKRLSNLTDYADMQRDIQRFRTAVLDTECLVKDILLIILKCTVL